MDTKEQKGSGSKLISNLLDAGFCTNVFMGLVDSGQIACSNATEIGIAITPSGQLIRYESIGSTGLKLWVYSNGKVLRWNSWSEGATKEVVNSWIDTSFEGYVTNANYSGVTDGFQLNSSSYAFRHSFNVGDTLYNSQCTTSTCRENIASIAMYDLPQSECNHMGLRYPTENEINTDSAIRLGMNASVGGYAPIGFAYKYSGSAQVAKAFTATGSISSALQGQRVCYKPFSEN